MTNEIYEELSELANEMSVSIEDLDDMEVLCACTGVSCLVLMSVW
jgi:hypothetical protein